MASTDTLFAPLPKLTLPVHIFMPGKPYMFKMLLGALQVVFLCIVDPRKEEGIAAPKPDLPTTAVCINGSIRVVGGAHTARNDIQLGEFVMIQPRAGLARRSILLSKAVALSGLYIGIYS